MSMGWRRGTLRDGAATAAPPIVKLGGSILGRPGWPREVAELLGGLPGPRVIVVGGGSLVDGLREMDAAVPQAPDLVHRLAIDCMGLTARLVATSLAVPLVGEATPGDPPTVVLDAPAWLERSGRLDRLPVGWHVTSDSIAALVAAELGAALLLAKSIPPPHDDLVALATAGWVDGYFPTAARRLSSITWAAPD